MEKEIRDLLASPQQDIFPFYGILLYHLGWVDKDFQPQKASSGKWIRPALCLLVCEALGDNAEKAAPAAAAVELVHNFSLVHDDVQDRSLRRRGRETVWKVWGDALAINAGDALLILAHLALQRLAEKNVSYSRITEALRILDKACLALSQGQYRDLTHQDREDITVEMYLDTAEKKTASLLEAAAHLGALLGTADQSKIDGFRRFARNLGLAFQITDDLLGIWGDEKTVGKGVGEDILARKKTLPVVYALYEEKRRGEDRLAKLYFGKALDQETAHQVGTILDGLGAREYTIEKAKELRDEALRELACLELSDQYQNKFRQLAFFLTERIY